jgi:hypothetical protein
VNPKNITSFFKLKRTAPFCNERKNLFLAQGTTQPCNPSIQGAYLNDKHIARPGGWSAHPQHFSGGNLFPNNEFRPDALP